MMLSLLLLLAQDPTVTIRVVDGDSKEPIFARVVLRDPAGKVAGTTGYRTLNGHVVFPEGWAASLAPGKYRLEADAGFEFFRHEEDWTVSGGGEKKIELKRWVNLRKQGWVAGGDHNHLNRDGAKDKNYGGTSVTMEFAAGLMASRGWSYYASGGGGPWIVDGSGACDAKDANNQTLNNGRRTEAACDAWNKKYGERCFLWWNNEIIKSRYGHVWFLGKCPSGPTFPYGEESADAWWALYDDEWDAWQTGDRTKPIPPYTSSKRLSPAPADCIRHWRDRGLVAIYAHPTRTFMIGKSRVSNIAVSFPFDLLAGVPVGLAIMGDFHDHVEDQALWFAALNEGFQVPGVAENDTTYGSPDIRTGPHVTYTHAPEMGASFDLAKAASALGAGRNFASSGAFCLVTLDGKHRPGDTVPADGKEHSLEIQAWATADPADAIDRLEVIADGKVARTVDAARGKREWKGSVPLKADVKWAIVKLICSKRGGAAIANPIYFRKPGEPPSPPPLAAAVSGKTAPGAEIAVTAWGKEVSRAKAGPDGSYRLEVPLGARLRFSHGGKSAERSIFFDDPDLRALFHRIYSTEFVGTPGAIGNALPAGIFGTIRDLAKDVTIDADLK
jgi:hypothetical protein